MSILPWNRSRNKKTWVEEFVVKTADLSWAADARRESLDRLFGATEDLAIAEIRYYHERRATWRWASGIVRLLAWAFGSLGIALPLWASARAQGGAAFAAWGYVMLAIAGAFVAANALFGGTAGHTRYWNAQLALERLVMLQRIQWQRLRSQASGSLSDAQLAEAFGLIQGFGTSVYAVIAEESTLWASTITEAVEKYATTVKSSGK
jgi:SMODS and SLOG-associating 2TM effector domain 2